MRVIKELHYKTKLQDLKEEYETTIRDLKNKVVEYKERLRLEQQKNAQSNDFGFDDDELAQINIENEALKKKMAVMEEEAEQNKKDKVEAEREMAKMQRALETTNSQLSESRKQLQDLKNLYNKLELSNEALKQQGGEKNSTAALKQFSELEKKYIQTKK